ncbi:MAG: S8 family serine peptidase [Asgard group archaeon]|nr:S8 family serine peptidase [Asgard group archaeon]
MRNVIKDIRLKNLSLMFILIFLVLPVLTINVNAPFFIPGPGDGGDPGDPGDPGTITITNPTANTEFYYLDKINVKYIIDVNPGFILQKSFVIVNGETRGTFYGTDIDVNIYPNSYVGDCVITIKANFFYNFIPKTKTSNPVIVKLYSAIDKDDISDLRIDKLHNMGYGGQGITICVIDLNLGFNDIYNGPSDLSKFHPSIYKEKSNTYREVYYYDVSWNFRLPLNGFGQSEESKKEIWETIAEENSRNHHNYETIQEIHGSYVMSSLIQVAPHARYVYINCAIDSAPGFGDLGKALTWLTNFNRFRNLGIDILSISMGTDSDQGSELFDIMINDPINPVIVLASAGNSYFNDVEYPAHYSNVIGVGGVQDNSIYQFYETFNVIDLRDGFSGNTDNHIWKYHHREFYYSVYDESYFLNGFEKYSMKVIGDSTESDRDYDGIQFWDKMLDGSIEACLKIDGTQEQTVSLWLRTGEEAPSSLVTFLEGYVVSLCNNEFKMRRYSYTDWLELDSKNINFDYIGKWVKIRFTINGDKLDAYLTNSEGLLIEELHAYDLLIDEKGKPGYSVSTRFDSPNYIYMDNIKIKTYDENPIYWKRYHEWMPVPHEGLVVDLNFYPVQGSSFGEGLDICSIFAATEIGWNPFIDDRLDENYEFAGTSNACPLVAGIIALNYQFWRQEHTTKLTVYRFLELNEEGIFVNTGDPEGMAPAENGEDPEGWSGYYIQKNEYYGHGLIDAYEIYCFLRDNW